MDTDEWTNLPEQESCLPVRLSSVRRPRRMRRLQGRVRLAEHGLAEVVQAMYRVRDRGRADLAVEDPPEGVQAMQLVVQREVVVTPVHPDEAVPARRYQRLPVRVGVQAVPVAVVDHLQRDAALVDGELAAGHDAWQSGEWFVGCGV